MISSTAACLAESNGTITIEIVGNATDSFVYNILGPVNLMGTTNQNPFTVPGLITGDYLMTVTIIKDSTCTPVVGPIPVG